MQYYSVSVDEPTYFFLQSRRYLLKTEVRRAILFGLEMVVSAFVHLGTLAINVRVLVIERRRVRYDHVAQSHVLIVVCIMRNTTANSNEKDKVHLLERSYSCTDTYRIKLHNEFMYVT